MRKLLALLVMGYALNSVAQTQPNFIPRVNGGGTNTALTNLTTRGNIRLMETTGLNHTNLIIAPTDNDEVSFILLGNAINFSLDPVRAFFRTNVVARGVFTGNGAGLTNLAFAQEQTFVTNVYFNATSYFNTILVTNNSTFNGKVTINSNVVINGTVLANGILLTNILEKNVVIQTNTWGNGVVDFTLGTQVNTNMAGAALTITGITGFNATNLNFQEIDINPNTFDTVVSVPAAWYVSGFTNGTDVTIPKTNWGKLRVETVIGRSTNASIEIFL